MEETESEAQEGAPNLLLTKSKYAYEKEMEEFDQWREKGSITSINEDVLLEYFININKRYACSSMLTKYSILKSMLKVRRNIDIGTYAKLIAYLKNESKKYKPKKAKILEREHVQQFLNKATDDKYLMMKVALIMGVAGGCRCNELTNLRLEDVEDKGSYIFVKIPNTKRNVSRSFVIVREAFSVDVIEICRKYMSLRPTRNISHNRFFVRYMNGKCTVQPIGINTLSRIPAKIAAFLELADAEHYTGHSMRRSSSTLLGVSGGWRSVSGAETSFRKNNESEEVEKSAEETSSLEENDETSDIVTKIKKERVFDENDAGNEVERKIKVESFPFGDNGEGNDTVMKIKEENFAFDENGEAGDK